MMSMEDGTALLQIIDISNETYSQNGSPTDGVVHAAPFLHGFGLHDGKPALETIITIISH